MAAHVFMRIFSAGSVVQMHVACVAGGVPGSGSAGGRRFLNWDRR